MHATLAKRAPCECEIALRLLEFQARKPKGAASRDKCNIRSSLDRGLCPSQGAHQTVPLRSVRSPQCPSTSAALLSPSELHPRIRLASVETALHWSHGNGDGRKPRRHRTTGDRICPPPGSDRQA